MMQRLIYAAAVVLCIQIGLTVALNINNTSLETTAPNTPFISFNTGEVTSIEITGAEGKQLVLQKTDTGWILPKSFSAPANKAQVQELLDKLSAAKKGFIVATTTGAAKRFKTAEDDFERHLILKEGEKIVGDFFLGTSAGFRHSYARTADNDDIVSIPISNFEMDADEKHWLDQNLAKIAREDIKRIELGDIILSKNDNDWEVNGLQAEQTAQQEVEKLLDKVTGITVQSTLDPKEVSSLFDAQPENRFTVTTNDETSISYLFAKQAEHQVLKMSTSKLYYKMDNLQVDELFKITYAALSKNTEGNVAITTEKQK